MKRVMIACIAIAAFAGPALAGPDGANPNASPMGQNRSTQPPGHVGSVLPSIVQSVPRQHS